MSLSSAHRPDRAGAVWPLVLSVLVHGAVGAAALTSLSSRATNRERPDTWSGDGVEVEALDPDKAGARSAEPAPSPAAAPASRPEPPPAVPEPESRASEPDEREALKLPAPAEVSTAKPVPVESTEPPGASSPDTGAQEATSDGGSPAQSPSLAGGASTEATQVRDLSKAFTRVLPLLGRADPFWFTAPLGELGSVRVRLDLAPGGELSALEIIEPKEPTPEWRGFMERARLMLRRGFFALPADHGDARSLVFHLHAKAFTGELTYPEHVPDSIMSQRYEPLQERAGKAVFSYASGRVVEIDVLQEP
jgi:hypothetical protein